MFKKMNLGTRLVLSFLVCGLVPMVIVAYISYETAQGGMGTVTEQGGKDLEEKAFAQLTALRDVQRNQVEDYFAARKSDMDVLTELVKGQRADKLAGIAEYKMRFLQKWIRERMADVHTMPLMPTYVDAAMTLTGRRTPDVELDAKKIIASEAAATHTFAKAWTGEDEDLKDAIAKIKVGQTGYVYVLDYEGNYVVSKDRKRDGENIWDARDADGVPFIQQAVAKGKMLTNDQVDYQVYPWRNQGETESRDKVAALVHLPDRQWVIGVSVYFDELINMDKYRNNVLNEFKINQKLHGYYNEMKLLDLQGNHLVSLLGIEENESDKTWFKAALANARKTRKGESCQDLYVSTIEQCPEVNRPAVHMAHVIRDRNTWAPIAMAVVVCNTDNITDIMELSVGLGETGESYLVGPDYVMRSNSRFEEEPTILKKKIETAGVRNVFEYRDTGRGQRQNWIYRNHRGTPVLSNNQYLEELDLAVITEMNVEEALDPRIKNSDKNFLARYNEIYGYNDVLLIDAAGYCFLTAMHESDYRTNLLTGEYKDSNLGELVHRVMSSKTFGFADFKPYAPGGGAQVAFIANPILDENGEVEIVVALELPEDQINEIMALRTGMGETGCTYLIGKNAESGATEFRSDLSFMDPKYVVGYPITTNYIEEAMKSPDAEGQKIFKDSHGNGVAVAYTGVDVFGEHWGLVSKIDEAEAMAAVKEMDATNSAAGTRLLTWVGAVGAVAGLCVLVLGVIMGRGIARPVVRATEVAEQIAQGDYTLRVDSTRQDEIGRLGGAIDNITDTMNDVLGEVNTAVEGVAGGGQQIADASQSLAQGATEQASSLEEITAAMTEMAAQTKQNAENAGQANRLSGEAKNSADQGNQQMESMVSSMDDINESSANISKIIKVIDEIAFQTNLLALNAAVEAARAGKHGKGFAVVAEEVRNLAARSAKAAQETTVMIEESVEKVKAGTGIAKQTAEALAEILNNVSKTTDLVGEIAAASNEQAQGIGQVNDGLGQLDKVTQQNTANAEESAAAAEQLASQAAQLKELVSQFKLRGHGGEAARPATTPSPTHTKLKPVLAAGSAAPENLPKPEIALDDDEFGRF